MTHFKIPNYFLSANEFNQLKKCSHILMTEQIEIDLTPEELEESKQVKLEIINAINGLTFFLKVKISGHTYSFSVGKFGLITTLDSPLVSLDDYDEAIRIWVSEIIPAIKLRLYHIVGMKKETYHLNYITQQSINNFIEVI